MYCEKHGNQSTFCRFCDAETVSCEWIKSQLTSDLDIYTVVRMARKDLHAGNLDTAVARLKSDIDKIRTHNPKLAKALQENKFE